LKNVADAIERLLDPTALIDALVGALDNRFDDEAIDGQQPAEPPLRLRDHPRVRQLQRLRALLENREGLARGRVLAAAADACRADMRARARRRNVLTFSMLIDGVHARLCGEQADARFAERLFEAFPAALIDEFQDTDQRQYAIFDRIYRDAGGKPRGTLVMIGDPKQAIYAFRGGDIAAYLRASEQARVRYSLATNHRSASALVGALNALYGDRGGFGHVGIDYQPVRAGGRADAAPWTVDHAPVAAPLVLHAFRHDALDANGNPLDAQTRLEELALDDCAERIAAQLMDAGQHIGGRRVQPGDIAVLVPTNAQVRALRERLV
jgi:exodeoxyribonuclease V beta subunit